MPCTKCQKDLPIANVKYNLCQSCNSVRLTGKTTAERRTESAKKYRDKCQSRAKIFQGNPILQGIEGEISNNSTVKENKFQYKIPTQTKVEAGIKVRLSLLKQQIRLEAIQNNEYFCQGCGKGQLQLDCSHILPVGQYKHLELVRGNIQLMCREDHMIWEGGPIEEKIKLNCFAGNVAFIYLHDQVAFNKLLTKIGYYSAFLHPTSDSDKILFINKLIDNISSLI